MSTEQSYTPRVGDRVVVDLPPHDPAAGLNGRVGWWSETHTVEVEHFESREAARQAETEAIKNENPRANVLGRRPGIERRPTRPPREWVVVSLRLSEDELANLKALAKANQRSMGGQVRYMVSQLEDPRKAA